MTGTDRNSPPDTPAPRLVANGHASYQKPDTRIPPKAAPVLREIAVNGVAVPEREILAEAQNHPAKSPGRALLAAAEALVIRELLWQEAQRLEIGAATGRDEAGRLETECDAAIRLLIAREVDAPTATEEECRRYYDSNPDKFRTEPLFEARHILVSVRESDDKDRAAAQAMQLCETLALRPDMFAALAQEHSDCPSREQGGNLGQLTRGSTVAEFEAALVEMKEGEIGSVPVKSRFGFHVIALDRKIDSRDLPYDIVSERISGWLEASSWSKAVSQYIAVLAGRADIRGIALSGADGPLIQ